MIINDEIADICVEIVRKAAMKEIVPHYRRLRKEAIHTKSSEYDLVTDADRRAEEFIRNEIEREFPTARFVGEEAVAGDPSLLDGISESDVAFIVDPIDGTWNFVNGLPIFGVMLAVVQNGTTQFGLIYDPLADDWIFAIRNHGAYWITSDRQKRPLKVLHPESFSRATGCIPFLMFNRTIRSDVISECCVFDQVLSLRCSAYEYRLLAQGGISFLLTPHPNPWDHAAGQLIHAEAGGFSAFIDGTPYSPGAEPRYLLVASSKQSWVAIRDHFSFLQGHVPECAFTPDRSVL